MKYGIFKKKDWRCLLIVATKEEGEKIIEGKKNMEVREIIGGRK